MNSALDSIKPLAGRVLQEALNRLLQLDPASVAKLQALQGRRIEARLQSPDIALAIDVADGQLRVGPVDPGREPDIGFSTRLAGLLQALPGFAKGHAPIGAMRISGDIELARLLQALVKGFDPDWQAPFVQAFGPVFGPQLAKAMAEGLRHARVATGNLARSGAEYVTEEARLVVGRAELADFLDQVDALRQRADRLSARVARLVEPR